MGLFSMELCKWDILGLVLVVVFAILILVQYFRYKAEWNSLEEM